MFSAIFFAFLLTLAVSIDPEEQEGVKYANKCEVCKILATELQEKLSETGRSHDVIELGYSLDDVKPKKRTEYRRSELRLLESMDGVCERILSYNLHKERSDSTRFAKGMSQTFSALHGLVNKGVKVELGIPYELWDKPPVEVTQMKTQCESLVEQYEDAIENWYFKHQDTKPLIKHLCEERVLKNQNHKCLYEIADNSKKKEGSEHDEKKSAKDKKSKKTKTEKNATKRKGETDGEIIENKDEL